jgi:hypothetical protein
MLQSKGYTPNQIREITNTTEKVVKEYLELYQKYGDIGKERIDQLLSTPKIEVENKKKEMIQ